MPRSFFYSSVRFTEEMYTGSNWGRKLLAMKKAKPKSKNNSDRLREQAEKRATHQLDNINKLSETEIKKLVCELEVHQIELEMQNEALLTSQAETTAERLKYEDLYNFAPVGYFTLDKKGHIIEANVTGAALLGRVKRYLIRQPFYRYIMHEYLSIFQNNLLKAIEFKGKHVCKLRLVKSDGSQLDVLLDTLAVMDKEDKFVHYRSSLTDITMLERSEAEVARLATFPHFNPLPIVEVDFIGQICFLNPAAELLFPDIRRCAPEHPWLKGWDVWLHTFHKEGIKESEREVNVNGNWYKQKIYIVTEIQLIRIYGMDITEHKLAEDLLATQAAQLQEQTAQLRESYKELESFSYSVSHDLKAPLRAIDGFSRKLLQEYGAKLDEEAMRIIGVIRRNTKTMGFLINDLLSFSRVQKTGLSISEIDMDSLSKEVWADISAAHKERELEFKIAGILPGFGDRDLIRQVLFNLISNAVKFSKNRNKGIIEISSYKDTDKNVYCLKDNGIGFDMAYYDKLFGVFQRLHSADEYEGTGIGLALVKRIINRHGGRVWAEGKVDEGAMFCFSLPSHK